MRNIVHTAETVSELFSSAEESGAVVDCDPQERSGARIGAVIAAVPVQSSVDLDVAMLIMLQPSVD